MKMLNRSGKNDDVTVVSEVVSVSFLLSRHSAQTGVRVMGTRAVRLYQDGKPTKDTIRASSTNFDEKEFAGFTAAGLTGTQVIDFFKDL